MTAEERVLKLEQVIETLSDVVIKENVIDPIYEVSSGSAKGDGYGSYMSKVIVKGNNMVLPLIIKCAPNILSMRESMPLRVTYLKEIMYYDDVFPAFEKFQINRGVENPFKSVPVCYKTSSTEGKEMLILENIKEQGFRVFERKKQMDDAHIEMVLKTYGEFHAVSFAMKEHDFEGFQKLAKNVDPLYSEKHLNQELFDMFSEGADKIRKVFDESSESDLHDYFLELKDVAAPFLKSIGDYQGKYGVLTHGDCWCNNMMFKYESENSTPPIEMRLFDFKLEVVLHPSSISLISSTCQHPKKCWTTWINT